MPKLTSKKIRTTALAVASCFSLLATPSFVEAAGMGKLKVMSGLGQPLRAEIDVMAGKDELPGMTVRLASREAFDKVGAEFSQTLADLSFVLEKRADGKPYVLVKSNKPVNDPFVNLLVELNWPTGRLMREYHFLLNPPEIALDPEAGMPVEKPVVAKAVPVSPAIEEKQPATATTDVPAAKKEVAQVPVTGKASSGRSGTKSRRAAALAPASGGEGAATADKHTVQQGETLAQIARSSQYSGVSLEQMLVAIVRANNDAFIDGNMNRMKAGQTLSIPDQQTVAAVPKDEARKIYLAQSSDWSGYRNKLARSAAETPESGTKQKTTGKITEVAKQPVDTGEKKDVVKLSSANASDAKAGESGTGKTKAAGNKSRNSAHEEDLIAAKKQLQDTKEAKVQIEKIVEDQKKLIEMQKDQLKVQESKMAALQDEAEKAKKAAATKGGAEKKSSEPTADNGTEKSPQSVPTSPVVTKSEPPAKVVEPPKVTDAPIEKSVEEKSKEEKPQPGADSKSEKVDGAMGSGMDASSKPDELSKPPEQPPKPPEDKSSVPKQPPPKPPEPEPEPEWYTDTATLAGGGGLLALLGIGAYAMMRRRRNQLHEATSMMADSSLSETSLGVNSVFRSTGGQSVDTTSAYSRPHTDFSQAGPGQIDTDEVDPVAEADVYMAYGRDPQAEEILLEALQKEPQRLAIHLKLLEIYSLRGSQKQFETLATELYGITGGVGSDWEKAAAMGARLDPNNLLYTGGKAAAGGESAAMKSSVKQAAATDIGQQQLKSTVTMPTGSAAAAVVAAAGAPESSILDFGPMSEAPILAASEASSLSPGFSFDLDAPAPASLLPDEQDLARTSPVARMPVVDTASPVAAVTATQFAKDTVVAPHTQTKIDSAETIVNTSLVDAAESETNLEFSHSSLDSMSTFNTDLDDDIGFDLTSSEVLNSLSHIQSAADYEPPPLEVVTQPDADNVEFDVSLTESTVLGSPTYAFDMASIDLDLDKPADTADSHNQIDEVTTKIDLAKAYEDMGDIEGARELLQEVIAEGTPEQKEAAQAAIKRLG